MLSPGAQDREVTRGKEGCQLRGICSQDNKALSVEYLGPEYIAEGCKFITVHINRTGGSKLKHKAHKEGRKDEGDKHMSLA